MEAYFLGAMLLVTYLILFIQIFLFSPGGLAFIGICIGLPLIWREKGRKPVYTGRNLKIITTWILCCIGSLLYLSVLNYCDGPSCGAHREEFIQKYSVTISVLLLVGYGLHRRANRT